MIKTISATGSDVVKIEDFSKGITLSNIRLDSTIKVDLVSANGKDRNVYPQMTVEQYIALFTSLTPREFITVSDNTAVEQFYLPFSLSGVLALTESEYYEVSLGNLNNRTIQVHNVDDLIVSNSPIQIDRIDIKSSLSEKLIPVGGYALAFFPNEAATKLETHSGNRKITFDANQIDTFNKENRITIQSEDIDGNKIYQLGTQFPSFPVLQMSEITVHKANNEMIFYLLRA